MSLNNILDISTTINYSVADSTNVTNSETKTQNNSLSVSDESSNANYASGDSQANTTETVLLSRLQLSNSGVIVGEETSTILTTDDIEDIQDNIASNQLTRQLNENALSSTLDTVVASDGVTTELTSAVDESLISLQDETNSETVNSGVLQEGSDSSELSDFVLQSRSLISTYTTTTSSWSSKEFCDQLAEVIGDLKTDYLEVYESVVEKYTNYYSDLSDIISELSNLITDGSDNKVTVNAVKLRELVLSLQSKYASEILYPTDSSQTVSQTEALDWANKLGLSESCVVASGSGYRVIFDLSMLDNIVSSLATMITNNWSNVEISSAKYQAWKAGFDAQIEKVSNLLQTLSQKYTTANSTYDNVVSVLSNTITGFYDVDKDFLKI